MTSDRSSTAERRELLAKATPGPWRQANAGGYGSVGFWAPNTGELAAFSPERLLGTAHQVGSGDDRIGIAEANAALIVAAVNDYARHLNMEDRVAALEEALRECADDLEAEIEARRSGELPRRIERDLAPVVRARALLTGAQPHVQ